MSENNRMGLQEVELRIGSAQLATEQGWEVEVLVSEGQGVWNSVKDL